MEVGFQLSYLAVLGIVYFQPIIYTKWYFKNWLLDKIWGITAVSIAAQIATFPLGLLYFHQFPVYFLFSNLVVIPGAMIIIGLGILLFVSSGFTAIASIVGFVLNEAIYWMNYLVLAIDKLPFSLIEGVSISILGCWLIYAIIVSLVPLFEFKKLKYFNMGLLLMSMFLVTDINEDYHIRNQKQLVIFDIKGDQAINFVDGQSNYFFASDNFILDRSKMQFHIKNYWNSLDANTPTYLDFDKNATENGFLKEGPFYFFNDLIVFYYSDSWTLGRENLPKINQPIDVVYITHLNVIGFEEMMNSLLPKIVVVGNDVYKKDLESIKIWCKDRKIECHSIKEKGAFVLTY
jgi:competence protein ComEC